MEKWLFAEVFNHSLTSNQCCCSLLGPWPCPRVRIGQTPARAAPATRPKTSLFCGRGQYYHRRLALAHPISIRLLSPCCQLPADSSYCACPLHQPLLLPAPLTPVGVPAPRSPCRGSQAGYSSGHRAPVNRMNSWSEPVMSKMVRQLEIKRFTGPFTNSITCSCAILQYANRTPTGTKKWPFTPGTTYQLGPKVKLGLNRDF
jgi:hypothetical protein